MPQMMFPTYSPFFNAGFLLPECTDEAVIDLDYVPRRSSLPSDAPPHHVPSTKVHLPSEETSAFYLTLQPKRDPTEFLSFLSLDLAESQSMRTLSSKRRKSSKRTSSWSNPFKQASYPVIEEDQIPPPLPSSIIRPPSPMCRRSSRASSRLVPSAKPPPSIALPSPPPTVDDVPPISPISTSSIFSKLRDFSTTPDLPPSLPPLRSSTFDPITHSLPRLFHLTLSPQPRPKSKPHHAPSPPLSPDAPGRPPIRHDSQRSVSTTMRNSNRSNALALLEGRTSNPSESVPLPTPITTPLIPVAPAPIPRSAPLLTQENFMSMFEHSDDECDDSDDDESQFADVQVPTSFIIPLNESLSEEDNLTDEENDDDDDDDDDDEGVAALAPRTCVAPKSSSREPSMYPLYPGVSFIDWGDDVKVAEFELRRKDSRPKPRNWRSFMEISGI